MSRGAAQVIRKKERENMSFGEAIQSVFSQYAVFYGRARRSEYWYFVLLTLIVSFVLSLLSSALGELGALLPTIWELAILVPSLAVVWRRLHDVGKSGGWYFIFLVPLVGWIILLVFLCKDSQSGENKFGPNPKEF